jgi:hypothetical protein
MNIPINYHKAQLNNVFLSYLLPTNKKEIVELAWQGGMVANHHTILISVWYGGGTTISPTSKCREG